MIEQTISALITAINELTLAINSAKASGTANVPQVAAPVAPVAQPAPQFTAPVATAPAMPAPPTFAPPAFTAPDAPADPAGAPFSTGQGLIAYVMGAYKEMGPAKGANIQGVLTSLGYQNINDVKPGNYAALYQGVEALKKG